jgi:hypothetical protein
MMTFFGDYPVTKHDKHEIKLIKLSNLNIFLYVQFSIFPTEVSSGVYYFTMHSVNLKWPW